SEGTTYDIDETEDNADRRRNINIKRKERRNVALLWTTDHSTTNNEAQTERQRPSITDKCNLHRNPDNFIRTADTQHKRRNTK
ncbi:hypothetical protein CHS0354_042738, partial [Potamilus streckersoni]